MWDEKSIYPRIETGYAYTKDMSIDLFNKFNNQPLTRGNVILKIRYYNPKDLIVQHLPNKEEVNRSEKNSMRNGFSLMFCHRYIIKNLLQREGKWLKFTKV